MAKSYRPVQRCQEFLLPPSMLDWLGEDHLVWFVIEAVRQLDTTEFHARAKLGGAGRCGYEPDMVLTLLIYAMAHGVSSSRKIERLCGTDVAFRVICANDAPDHTVLARFRQHHEAALRELLTESLVLAARLGMVSLGVVALDGVKIAGNASREATRSEATLRRIAEDYLAEAAEADAAEDARFGEARGDELPEELATRGGRAGRIGQALAQAREQRAEAERAEAERSVAAQVRQRRRERAAAEAAERAAAARAYEQAVAAGDWSQRRPGGVDRAAVARQRYEQAWDAAAERYAAHQQARAQGQAPAGRPPQPPQRNAKVARARRFYDAAQAGQAARDAAQAARATQAAARAERAERDAARAAAAAASPQQPSPTGDAAAQADGAAGEDSASAATGRANMTDPDSRLLKTRNGWLQGYNCFDPASEDGFILSARATTDANDMGQFVPTTDDLAALAATLRARSGRDDLDLGTTLADAGFDSHANAEADGPDRIIANAKRTGLARAAADHPAHGDPPADATARERMDHRLRTPEGHTLYKRRSHIGETPHATLKQDRGLTQFTRRGLTAVHSEFAFAHAVTNLIKIATHGITTSHLQTC